jgi:hypothetical protein
MVSVPGGPSARVPVPTPLGFDRARLVPTIAVAAVIAAVVLGGLALDGILPAPSAGTQHIDGSVTMTAASGWVLVPARDAGSGSGGPGIRLQKGDATLAAQVVGRGYAGDSASIMSEVRAQLDAAVAQISYGDQHRTSISGNDSTYVLFEAIVSGSTDGAQPGTIDGELVCMIVSGNAVVVEAAAPQGDLRFVTEDISAMVATVRATR